FRAFAEFVVVRGFFADDEAPAVVAGVEPFGTGSGASICAVESNAGAHFDEGSALRKISRLFILDADKGCPLIILENTNGTDGDFVASFGLSDGVPFSGSAQQGDYYHRSENHNREGK